MNTQRGRMVCLLVVLLHLVGLSGLVQPSVSSIGSQCGASTCVVHQYPSPAWWVHQGHARQWGHPYLLH